MKFDGDKIRLQNRKLTRRTFMASSAAAAFTIVSRSVHGGVTRPAPSERINLAFIGTGDQGMGNLNNLLNLEDVEVVAVCDVAKIVDYLVCLARTRGWIQPWGGRAHKGHGHKACSHLLSQSFRSLQWVAPPVGVEDS